MTMASSSVPLFGSIEEEKHVTQQQQPQPGSAVAAAAAQPAAPPPPKKRRNLPRNPSKTPLTLIESADPDAEVIALSPKTLLATNRFICEVCNKGFQREQNLQLHRRGHNLPWKLKQKNPKDVRRRVYVCPEPTCAHHDPSRALGDLTGIKKHYCRKHGEKKWKCDKCSKRYAVQSDWKAHSKTCGTREYRCDCGTLFSRRDSFITHRAFCDALAQESARVPASMNTIGSHFYGNTGINLGLPHLNSQLSTLQDQTHPSADLLRLGGNGNAMQFNHLTVPSFRPPPPPQSAPFYLGGGSSQDINENTQLLQSKPFHGFMQLQHLQTNTESSSPSAAAAATNLSNLGIFSDSSNRSAVTNSSNVAMNQNAHLFVSDPFNTASGSNGPNAIFAGNIVGNNLIDANMSPMCNNSVSNESMPPHMSATALLQKATQMGATSSCISASSSLRGVGSLYSSAAKNAGSRTVFDSVESEGHFQDLVNSLTNETSGILNGGNQQETGFSGFGATDRLTRDFLGVGSMMRRMGGVLTQREEQHLGIDMASLDPELKSVCNKRY
ncbi:unnamed protein product [Musa hybrid cultivar]